MLHSVDSTKFLFLAIAALSCGLCHGIDRDRDGLDDKWEQLHSISEPNGDFDGDGITNYAEYRFGTNPKSFSNIGLSVTRASNGTKTIAWSGLLHKRYLVQYSEDMVNWYSFSGVLDGTGTSQNLQDTNNWPSKRFYRLAAQESLDSDGDGVDDWLETNVYASNHLDAVDWLGDADKDRVPDIYEETKGTDKNNPASTPAADLFVNPLTGNISPTDNIYSTITEAINAAPSNDSNGDRRRIISVKPGTYQENLYLTDTKKVVLLAESSAQETIIHSPNYYAVQLYSSGCVLDGFVFSRKDSPSASYPCVYFYANTANSSSILSNCIIREGFAGSAGGIYIGQGSLIVEQCTITNNQASIEGSAVYIGNSSKLTLRNSIVWGNFGVAPQAIKRIANTSLISVSNSWIQGGEQGGIASDPLISVNGYLSANSPARNVSPAIASLKKDIHGEQRDSFPDAGADEFISSDGDTLPDFWETQFFGNLSQGDSGDSDNDGLSNLAEFAIHFTKPNIADTDGDGWNDGPEVTAGTKPLIPDTDGDGMFDGYELNTDNRLNPLSDDSLEDKDGDRVPNVFEFMRGMTKANDSSSKPTTTFIVNPATGGNSGTDNIYTTIQAAITAASQQVYNSTIQQYEYPGHYAVIEVAAGIYPEQVNLTTVPVLLIGELGAASGPVTLTGSSAFDSYTLNIPTASVVDGFVITHSAGRKGLGVQVSQSTGTDSNRRRLVNCLIRGNDNQYGSGGAINQSNSLLDLVHCTITGNQSNYTARGIYSSGGNLNLINSIVWGNGGTATTEIFKNTADPISVVNSITAAGEHEGINSDPQLTIMGWLKSASPAINRSDVALSAVSLLDIHGEARPSGSSTDIGADEYKDNNGSADGDGLPDWVEGADDSDGLSSFAEYNIHGTNPFIADTDGDGLNDGAEIATGTNPHIPDTDGDGMNDGVELHADNALNPLIDDSLEDKDGDRVPNIFELKRGTKANDSSSKPAAIYIVNPATGGNSGTDNIYTTIQAAINAANQQVYNSTTQQWEYPGRYAVIEVAAGIYSEQVTLSTVPILLLGELGATSGPVMLTGNSVSDGYTLSLQTASVVDGFIITHSLGRKGMGVQVTQSYGSDSNRRRLVNCIIRGNDNQYGSGGGIYQMGSLLDLVHCTITGNKADYQGKGIYTNGGKLNLINSIVWGNSGTATKEIFKDTSDSISVVKSIIFSGEHEGINVDPQLVPSSHLKSASSPVHAAALLLNHITRFDIQGEPRESQSDIGADEFFSSDGDSLPDFWERQYFGNLTKGDLDDNDAPTGDGLTNYYEYRFGFNPLLPLSPGNTGNDLTAAIAKRNIETTDEDEDGLTGGDELFYGSNPQLVDSNGDGLGDGLALHLNLSLTSNDTDSDGISNALEAANGTNPLVSDTDGDGVRDDIDAYPLDPERSTFTPGSASDGVAPIITLLEPFGAVQLP